MQVHYRCIGVAIAAFIGCVGLPGVASANGRFPAASQLVVAPSDPSQIAVQTTYGFIETKDAGKNWGWICEDAALYGGVLDPPIGIMQNSALIAGVFKGLTVATPDTCSLASAPGDLSTRFVVDVAVEKGDTTRAIAITSNGVGMSQFDTRLFETHDNAQTWTQAGVALPPDFLALTSDAAPSDPNRVYVSGFKVVTSTSYTGSLARSSDRGATWEVVPVPGSDNATGPYIGAIDPSDPNTIYVRLAGDTGKLLVTHDAGTTWTTIYNGQGALLAFALSPDGKTVLVGGVTDGVQRASSSDLAFAQASAIHARCLAWSGNDVYACGVEAQDGFTVGLSGDNGSTFSPVHHLSCLSGPLSCPADSDVTTKCQGPWAVTKQTLQTDSCAASMTTSSTGTGTAGTGASGPSKGSSSGCSTSCSTASTRSDSDFAFVLIAAVGLVALRRREPRRTD